MLKLFIYSLALILVSNCDRKPSSLKFKELKRSSNLNSSILASGEIPLTYANLKEHILTPKCLSCHSDKKAKPDFDPINFTTYESAMTGTFVPLLIKGEPEKSRLYQVVHDGSMPTGPDKLSQVEIDFIKSWIEACAPKEEKDIKLDGNCSDDTDVDEPGEEPGDDEPGNDEPGDDEPGDDEPGDDEPGEDEPGEDEPGDDEPGDEIHNKTDPKHHGDDHDDEPID